MFWSVGWPVLRAEDFFYNLDILYGGLGIGKLQFLIKKEKNNFSCNFFSIFGHLSPRSVLDPDPDLDPDPNWSPTSNSGSGSGSVKNEYGSTTLYQTTLVYFMNLHLMVRYYLFQACKIIWLQSKGLKTGFRIQHFRLNTDPEPDPGFWWPKVKKNLQLKKKFFFLDQKIQFNFP